PPVPLPERQLPAWHVHRAWRTAPPSPSTAAKRPAPSTRRQKAATSLQRAGLAPAGTHRSAAQHLEEAGAAPAAPGVFSIAALPSNADTSMAVSRRSVFLRRTSDTEPASPSSLPE